MELHRYWLMAIAVSACTAKAPSGLCSLEQYTSDETAYECIHRDPTPYLSMLAESTGDRFGEVRIEDCTIRSFHRGLRETLIVSTAAWIDGEYILGVFEHALERGSSSNDRANGKHLIEVVLEMALDDIYARFDSKGG